MRRFWWVAQGRSKNFEVVWAPRRGNGGQKVPHWGRLAEAQAGDLVIHYANGRVVGMSRVLGAAHASKRPTFAESQWSEDGSSLPVDFAYFEVPLVLTEIPIELRAPAPTGPFDVNFEMKQGYFYEADADLASFILAQYGLELRVMPARDGEYIAVNGSTDRQAMMAVRVEQSRLRVELFQGKAEARCGICGLIFPARYLNVAHIKRRARASERERRDLANVMLACTLGCDAAFEHGDIQVTAEGKVALSSSAPQQIGVHFGQLVGEDAPAFCDRSARYFKQHRQAHSMV